MDANEINALFGALKSINKCLDERFEKNAKLYIAAGDVEEIKELIYTGNYRRIVEEYVLSKSKNFSPEIISNVLIKNAWLMRKNDYEIFKPIFETCNYAYFKSFMFDEGVFDNKIEMPVDFRLMLIKIFIERVEQVETGYCLNMLEKNFELDVYDQNPRFINRPEMRALCVYCALKNMSPLDRYENFKKFAEQWPVLLSENAAPLLIKLFDDAALTNPVKDKILLEDFNRNDAMAINTISFFWIKCLAGANAEYMLKRFIDVCKSNPGSWLTVDKIIPCLFFLMWKNKVTRQTLADYAVKACKVMSGDNKTKLAERFVMRPRKKEEKDFFINEFKRNGIIAAERKLLTLEEMVDMLNRKSLNENQYRLLVVHFRKQFEGEYESKLNTLKAQVNFAHFKEFCCCLIEQSFRPFSTNILRYTVKNVITAADTKATSTVARMLDFIKNNPTVFYDADIKNFVRQKDFELFKVLAS